MEDILKGGSRARLAKLHRYVSEWNTRHALAELATARDNRADYSDIEL